MKPPSSTHEISLPATGSPLLRGHLDLGGTSILGDTISVTNRYLEWNGRPFIPVIGEIHFSRHPAACWDEAIRKMKSGGITVIATYIFWNMHEREEGVFNWAGDFDLRHFVELCAKNKIHVIARLGPFCHGEIRNGGLPDWLYGQPFDVRSNNPQYLHYVDRLYGQIGAQLKGLLFADGGPVIGIQVENEYQHSAAPWEFGYPTSTPKFTVSDRDTDVTFIQITVNSKVNRFANEGRDHMATLKRLAISNGLGAPLVAATGWGNAAIVEKGSIPVTAGYPYPYWAAPAPSPFYLFKDIRLAPDYPPASFDTNLYPSIPAELGAGMSISHKRRPVVPPESSLPMMIRTMGSGSNGIGYYMMHGGSNPVIGGQFYNEQASGLPRINYDYQAPLGEFGQQRANYYTLRTMHTFLAAFGDRLAPMETYLPASAATQLPEQVDQLRYAVRSEGGKGFVFMHQFQDHVAAIPDLENVSLTIRQAAGGVVRFPQAGGLTLKRGRAAILPFNFDVGPLLLKTATAQPFTVLTRNDGRHHVFFSIDGMVPEFVWAGYHKITGLDIEVVHQDDQTLLRGHPDASFRFTIAGETVLVLTETQATRALVFENALYLSDFDLFFGDTGIEVRSIGATFGKIRVYPAEAEVLRSSHGVLTPLAAANGFRDYSLAFTPHTPKWTCEKAGVRRLVFKADWPASGVTDLWLRVPYNGDRVEAYIHGKLVGDHLYQGSPWEVGLRKFGATISTDGLMLLFHPSHRSYPYLQDIAPENLPRFVEGQDEFLEIGDLTVQSEYRATLIPSQ
jgi:hypothetical protein